MSIKNRRHYTGTRSAYFRSTLWSKNARVFVVLGVLFLLSGYLFLWVLAPNSKSVQAPVVVASCDCDTLPHLSVKIINKNKLQISSILNNAGPSTGVIIICRRRMMQLHAIANFPIPWISLRIAAIKTLQQLFYPNAILTHSRRSEIVWVETGWFSINPLWKSSKTVPCSPPSPTEALA